MKYYCGIRLEEMEKTTGNLSIRILHVPAEIQTGTSQIPIRNVTA
jgi:hypothetical protein